VCVSLKSLLRYGIKKLTNYQFLILLWIEHWHWLLHHRQPSSRHIALAISPSMQSMDSFCEGQLNQNTTSLQDVPSSNSAAACGNLLADSGSKVPSLSLWDDSDDGDDVVPEQQSRRSPELPAQIDEGEQHFKTFCDVLNTCCF